MSNSIKKSKEVEKYFFIEAMNAHYYSPKEISYRIPKDLEGERLVELIRELRIKKSEPLFMLPTQDGQFFGLWKTPTLEKILHQIDIERSKWSQAENPSQVLQELRIQSLIDEAFHSSWIEGARTTRRRAEELVRKGQEPINRSEQMCLNNYRAMEFILKNLKAKVDEEFIGKLHFIVTEKTLDSPDEPFAGRYRNDHVFLYDDRNKKVEYDPPPHKEIRRMMESLFAWINLDEVDVFFLHPVIKAALIHFYTVYVHPFFDGNGRTARALMYHYLLKHDYGFMQFFSVSKAIAAKHKTYYRSLLNVENYDSDTTYFVLFCTKMISEAITTVEVEKEKEESLIKWLKQVRGSGIPLNSRQESLFKLHFRKGIFPISIKNYRKINKKIVYQTARTDLMSLVDAGLLQSFKRGRELMFDLPQTPL